MEQATKKLTPEVAAYKSLLPKSVLIKHDKQSLLNEIMLHNLYNRLPKGQKTSKKDIVDILHTFLNSAVNTTTFTIPIAADIEKRYLSKTKNQPVKKYLKPVQHIMDKKAKNKMYTLGDIISLNELNSLQLSHASDIIFNKIIIQLSSKDDVIRDIMEEAHNQKKISEEDYNTFKSKSFQLINSLNVLAKIKLMNLYKIPFIDNTRMKYMWTLKLFNHGILFYDIIFAMDRMYDMFIGNVQQIYKPKPNEYIEKGVYEWTGKVDKKYKDNIEPIPTNPYSYLSKSQLMQISDDRKMGSVIKRHKHQLIYVTVFTTADEVLPDWSQNIINKPLSNSRAEIYYKLGLNNIDMTNIKTSEMSTLDIRELIFIKNIINKPAIKPFPRKKAGIKSFKTYEEQMYYQTNSMAIPLVAGDINSENRFTLFGDILSEKETLDLYNDLVQYPSKLSFSDFRTIGYENIKNIKVLLKQKYKVEDPYYMTNKEIFFMITRGYTLPIPNIANYKLRYEKFKNSEKFIKNKLYKLYNGPVVRGVTSLEDKLYFIARQDQINPLEDILQAFLVEFDKVELIIAYHERLFVSNDLTTRFGTHIGMTIPKNIRDKSVYFADNFDNYKYMMVRKNINPFTKEQLTVNSSSDQEVRDILRNYSDNEIFLYSGFYMPYRSRDEIIQNVVDLRSNTKFFVPTLRSCSNELTVGLDDVNDSDLFIIGYGTIFEYHCFDIEDLLEGFTDFDVEGSDNNEIEHRFRNPTTIDDDFSNTEIKQLNNLIKPYLEKYPDLLPLKTAINDGLKRRIDPTDYDNKLKTEFNKLSNDDKLITREWLYQLFLTGMYMRRWDGPPEKYPMSKSSASKAKPDPNNKVLEELAVLGYYPTNNDNDKKNFSGITERLSVAGKKFVDQLRTVYYNRKNITQINKTIGAFLYDVRRGKFCIRMASGRFTGTGSYYLNLLYRFLIPNFEPTKLVMIV